MKETEDTKTEATEQSPTVAIDKPTDQDEKSEEIIEDAISSFDEVDLESSLKEAIAKLGWTKPTPVQGMCLPHTVVGKDVAGFAQTGTGKTGVFLITIANEIIKLKKSSQQTPKGPLAIILVPTRELAVQIHSDAAPIFDANDISSVAVYGGVDYEKQAKQIKSGANVIVATPGRLKDYFNKKVFHLKYCLQFVCDEADRMFDMGFIDDVEFFLDKLSEETQKLLFSATTNEKVKELAFEYLEEPEYISVNPEVMTPERIEQHALACESTEKLSVLLGLIKEHKPTCSIIFTNTKLVAEWVHYKLVGNGIEADLITGDLPQRKRISLINRIKKGEVTALIATDVASRGLHISDISHVYNFDLPNEAANYVHRIGRTARAGAEGAAYSLVCEDYGQYLEPIREYLGETVPINVELPSAELLATKDEAKNPYQDPNFVGTTTATKPKPKQESRKPRQGGNSKQDKKGDQSKRGDKNRRGEQKNRSGAKGPKGQDQRNRPKKSRQYDRNRPQRDGKQIPAAAAKTKAGTTTTNRSVGSIVKKFVKLIFGKK